MFLFGAKAEAQANADGTLPSTRPLELSWLVPEGCPTSEQVIHEVGELTAGSTPLQKKALLAASGTVTSAQDGFALTLTLRDDETVRSRTLEAPSCAELARAASLIIALAIDPSILERRNNPDDAKAANLWSIATQSEQRKLPTPEQNQPDLRNACSKTVVPAPVADHPKDLSQVPLPYRFGIGLLGGFGVLPQSNVGVTAIGAIVHKVMRLELAASKLSATAHLLHASGIGANFDLYRLAPRGCWLIADKAWSAGPCASVEIGVVTGQGHGLTTNNRKTALWFGSAVGGMFEWRAASSSFLGVSADLGIPIRRDHFNLAGKELYRPAISGTVILSLSAGWH